MINFYTKSQASFREKRMVFEHESSPGIPEWSLDRRAFRSVRPAAQISASTLRARSADGDFGFHQETTADGLGEADKTVPEAGLPGPETGLDGEVSVVLDAIHSTVDSARAFIAPAPIEPPVITGLGPLPSIDTTVDDAHFAGLIGPSGPSALAFDATHDAFPVSTPPAAVEAPEEETPRVSVTRSAPAVAAPTVARTAQSTFVPEKPHQPSSFREPIAKATATHAQPAKTGFFSRLMARITGPTQALNPETTKLRQPASLRESKQDNTLPVDLYGQHAATNMPHTAKARLHNTILFDNQNVPANLPLATRLENSNSNDLYAYAKAKYPTLKIEFDGTVGGIFQKIAFARAIAKDPELRACTEELQNRARHIKSVTGNY